MSLPLDGCRTTTTSRCASHAGVRRAVVETLGQLEPATLAQHGAALVARLEDEDPFVRLAVAQTLMKLESGTLA